MSLMRASRVIGRPSVATRGAPSSRFTALRSERPAGVRPYSTLYKDYVDQLPRYLLNVPETKVSYLNNGFTVASEQTPGETATVGVWINAGSAYETAANNGVAHFLEHLSFKGTKNRSYKDIEAQLENSGGLLNAYTAREQTVYYARVFKKDIAQAVDLLADILQNSTLAPEKVEQEKSTIVREMADVDANETEVIFEHLHSIAFQGTSHGFPILGPEKNVLGMRRELLKEYIDRHYTAPRMVLAAAGDIDHAQLKELAEKNFGGLSAELHGDAAPSPAFTGSGVTIRNDELPLVHFAVGFESVAWSNPDYFVFLVIQNLIGQWDRNIGGGKNLTSRLAELLADTGLATSMMAFNTPYHNTGLFGVYATCEAGKGEDAAHEIVSEFVRFSRGISETEVERARNKLKSSILMNLDGTQSVAEDIGRQITTLGRRLTPAEIFMRIDMVTAEEVKRVAEEYFYDNDLAYAAMGPTADFPDYNYLRGWTHSHRI